MFRPYVRICLYVGCLSDINPVIWVVFLSVVTVAAPPWRRNPNVWIVFLTEEVSVVIFLYGLEFNPLNVVLTSGG